MIISLVYAVSKNGVIGDKGGLPWHVPSDLKHFKAVTLGKPIIMGRKTWESLPRKPLPGRLNIVLTRDAGFAAERAFVAGNVPAALALAGQAEEICVIGGAEVFKAFLPSTRKIYLTRILAMVKGDVMMPELDAAMWREVSRSGSLQAQGDSAAYETLVYERR
ncbi:MAG TPA: dihydrofolate reductase [Aestuariivirga sp.]